MSKEVDLPESSRTNNYNQRSWNRVNDHYDSNKDYKKMYGSLVQDPEWISSPFVAAKIYQGGEQPAYFPDAQQFMPQKGSSAEPEEEESKPPKEEEKPPKEDISWREVPLDTSYPTAPFARARIYQPENGHESYYPNTLDNYPMRSQTQHREGETESDSDDKEEGPKYAPTQPFARARIYSPENGHQNYFPNR